MLTDYQRYTAVLELWPVSAEVLDYLLRTFPRASNSLVSREARCHKTADHTLMVPHIHLGHLEVIYCTVHHLGWVAEEFDGLQGAWDFESRT